jgi:hypothetical protein
MEKSIKCPNCGHDFQVEEVLAHQAEERAKKEFEKKLADINADNRKKEEDFQKEKDDFEKKKERENELFKERLELKVQEEKAKFQKEKETDTQKIRKEIEEQNASKLKSMQEDIDRKSQQNKALQEKELEFMRKESQFKEQQENFKMEMERSMFEKKEEIAEEARKKEREKQELKDKEYQKRIEDQNKLIDEMKRKAEQGSMQMQGEVLELALEELLISAFKEDIIEEVGKGVRGADIIQTVVNQMRQVCGKIIFESKRTKTFSETWIEKLKDDQRDAGAAIAVLVTEVMPKDMDKFGRKDGVWVCTYHEVKALTFVLREILIREFSALATQENKGTKMELLYNYLVSEEFKHRIESIVEGFSILKSDIEKEKRVFAKRWKEREKQIEKVMSNTIDMYGSIKGIGGSAIGDVKALELDSTLEDLEDDE